MLGFWIVAERHQSCEVRKREREDRKGRKEPTRGEKKQKLCTSYSKISLLSFLPAGFPPSPGDGVMKERQDRQIGRDGWRLHSPARAHSAICREGGKEEVVVRNRGAAPTTGPVTVHAVPIHARRGAVG